jgi:hypothetical protein
MQSNVAAQLAQLIVAVFSLVELHQEVAQKQPQGEGDISSHSALMPNMALVLIKTLLHKNLDQNYMELPSFKMITIF